MQKYTKTEKATILDEEDRSKIAKKLAKTGYRAIHELTDEEREDILRELRHHVDQ